MTLALSLAVASAALPLANPSPAFAAIVSAYTSTSREPIAPGVQYDQGRIVTSTGSQAANGYTWQFVPAGSGTFKDAGSGTCR